jgi:hypothetical protein
MFELITGFIAAFSASIFLAQLKPIWLNRDA